MERIGRPKGTATAFDDEIVQARIAEYIRDCLDSLEADVTRGIPPAPSGVESRDGGQLRLVADFEITGSEDAAPTKVICPDGMNGDCWREQRTKGGQTYWVWVCNCY